MKLISLTHECVIEKNAEGNNFYQGPSPDEIELVEFAKKVGFELTKVTKTGLTIDILAEHLDTSNHEILFAENRLGEEN